MFFKKSTIMFVSVVLASIFVFIFCIVEINAISTEATTNLYTVILDAGHGGRDGGVTGKTTNIKESDLNLTYVRTLKSIFEGNGVKVVLTRNSEEGLYGLTETNYKKADMKKRKEIIEDTPHDLVISIHMNYYPLSSCRGAQVFYYSTDKQDNQLAGFIQGALNSVEENAKDNTSLYGDYYILKCSKMPSVIVECGFLSNSEDEKLLVSSDYQQKLCKAIFDGAMAFLMN